MSSTKGAGGKRGRGEGGRGKEEGGERKEEGGERKEERTRGREVGVVVLQTTKIIPRSFY